MKISEPNPNVQHIEALRKQFVSDFDRGMLENMTLEQYAVERRIVSGTDDGLFSGDPVSLATHSDRGDMYFAA